MTGTRQRRTTGTDTAGGRRWHWDTWVLVVVAIVCTYSLIGLSDRHYAAQSPTSYPTAIAGLSGKLLEQQLRALDPGADPEVMISSGKRSVYLDIGAGPSRGSVYLQSRISDGAVEGLNCAAYSTPGVPLQVAVDPALRFCATLPITGGSTDTASWLQQQFDTATVGYSHSDNHGGARYGLTFSQVSNTTTSYSITVDPPRNY